LPLTTSLSATLQTKTTGFAVSRCGSDGQRQTGGPRLRAVRHRAAQGLDQESVSASSPPLLALRRRRSARRSRAARSASASSVSIVSMSAIGSTGPDVDHVRVVEAADDVGDRRDLADVAEELVAEALAAVGAGDEAGDVDELDGGGDDRRDAVALGVEAGQGVEARVRNRDDADVAIDRGEGVVGGLDAGPRDGVEQGALPDVGKTDDADSEHGLLLRVVRPRRGGPVKCSRPP
jgi:hypothetical protein